MVTTSESSRSGPTSLRLFNGRSWEQEKKMKEQKIKKQKRKIIHLNRVFSSNKVDFFGAALNRADTPSQVLGVPVSAENKQG